MKNKFIGIFLTVFLGLNSPLAYPAYVPTTIEEQDGSPSVANLKKLKVPNSSLTDNGSNVASISYVVTESDPKVGTLTDNYAPKWSSTSLTNSTIYDNGNVGIGTTTVPDKLTVAGSISTSSKLTIPMTTATTGSIDTTFGNAIHFYTPTLTPTASYGHNIFIGKNSGNRTMTGDGVPFGVANFCAGEDSCANMTNSYFNYCIGYKACEDFGSGSADNVCIGSEACRDLVGNTNYVTAIGDKAMYHSTGQIRRATCIGTQSCSEVKNDGVNNLTDATLMVGSYAGRYISDSRRDVIIGHEALERASSNSIFPNSADNVFIGYYAGFNGSNWNPGVEKNVGIGSGVLAAIDDNTEGNIAIGYQAADNITTGENNIIIGKSIDAPSATTSGQLSIGNLIYGTGLGAVGTTVSTGKVGIGTNTPTTELEVVGDVTTSGDVYAGNVNYNEGMLEDPTVSDATGVAVSVTEADCLIRSDSTWDDGKLYRKTVPANTALAVTDDSINYIYVTWNSGSPIYAATTDRSVLNNSDSIPVARIYMDSGDIEYQLLYQYVGKSAAIRNFDRVMRIRGSFGIERESGLAISETATRVINIASGYAWFGISRKSMDAVVQGAVGVASHLWYHSGGVWTEADITQYNNTQYDNGTNLATLTSGRYAVNWVFRNLVDDEVDVVLGTGDYTLAQAEASQLPALPDAISNFYVLCGRIIVQKNSSTAYAIENVSTTAFSQASVTVHNDLSSIQGGTTGEYYHLTSAEYTGTGTGNFVRATAPSFATSISTPSIITASGALGITPASGSNLNVTLGTTGDFAVNTNHLYVDTSAGNVGIGTTTPATKLNVIGTGQLNTTASATSYAARESVLQFALANYPTTYLNRITSSQSSTPADSTINFEVASGASTYATPMTLNGAGNVGIGTSSPATLFDIGGKIVGTSTGRVGIGTTAPAFPLDVRSNAGNVTMGLYNTSASGYGFVVAAGGSSSSYYLFRIRNYADTTSSGFLVRGDGKVGIANEDPGLYLDVRGGYGAPTNSGTTQTYGSIRATATVSNSPAIDMGTDGANYGWIQVTNKDDLSDEKPLALNQLGGKVGIGTSSPSEALHVIGKGLLSGGLKPRVTSVTSDTTPDPDWDTQDLYAITALAGNITTFNNPTGTPTDGQKMLVRIKDDGTARSISWGTAYRAIGITLPTTTVASKTMYLGLMWNAADSKVDVSGLAQEA